MTKHERRSLQIVMSTRKPSVDTNESNTANKISAKETVKDAMSV